MKFVWDPVKNAKNQRKHGIDFREAKSVFQDKKAVRIDDDEHSQEEERYIIIGVSRKERELMVCHCLKDDGDTIRIFSARRATKTEKAIYERSFL